MISVICRFMLGLPPECCSVKFKTVHCQIYQFIFRVTIAIISIRLKATLSVKNSFLPSVIVITLPMTRLDALLTLGLSFEKRIFRDCLICFLTIALYFMPCSFPPIAKKVQYPALPQALPSTHPALILPFTKPEPIYA